MLEIAPKKSTRPGWLLGPPSANSKEGNGEPVAKHPLEKFNLTKANYPEGIWGVVIGEGYDWRVVKAGCDAGDSYYLNIYRNAKRRYDSLPD